MRVRRGGRRRGSRVAGIADAGITDARFETGVQNRARGERGREHELRVALTQEEHRRGHGLRVAPIQERVDRVKELLGRRR